MEEFSQSHPIDVDRLVKQLEPLNAEKIILFGSYAKQQSHSDSDIDVLIVAETDKRPAERVNDALALVWGQRPNVEPHVLTPREFQRAIDEHRSFIVDEVLKYGTVVYERG